MGTKRCKKKDYKPPQTPAYYCKKCERLAKKEKKLCKAKKIKTRI